MESPFSAMFALMPCGIFSIYAVVILFGSVISIGGLIIWILMLVDVLQRDISDFPQPDENQRLIWVLVLVFGNWIGALLYYLLVYRQAKQNQ
jgi:prolipoprotein diacylglyceryltransferase